MRGIWLVATVLWGCQPERSAPPVPKLAVGGDYSRFKSELEAFLSVLGGGTGNVALDWKSFDSAVALVRSDVVDLQEPLFDAVGRAQAELGETLSKWEHKHHRNSLTLYTLPRLLAAAALIDFSSAALSEDDKQILRAQAVSLLKNPGAAKPKTKGLLMFPLMTDLCLVVRSDKPECVKRALRMEQGVLIAARALKGQSGFRLEEVISVANSALTSFNMGRPGPALLRGIEIYEEFLDIFLRAPEPSLAARDAAALELFGNARRAIHNAVLH